jgi:hypothetical protein
MTNVPDPGEIPGNPPKPIKHPRPKRGAFPTPESEIEKAKPYIPDAGEPGVGEKEDCPEGNSDRPANAQGEKEG